ncbi:thiamine phosphate synthase [Nitrogeniibacter mangrovi]|uniref:Thiamine-phosphate synthase n=1 Tax=Nitrogeniibacter mangrovi TaxID=2016596 RepID=A0A6C1B0K2_9RHOO|nr:thiamine phosphate synthase [Nitrogeniibacter mangrovi]QID16903.1 thiamine phosphate synthase [Nitrogeniibacter mangrovi]
MSAWTERLADGLYLITPEQADTEALVARVEALLPARPAVLQYRNKTLDAAGRRTQAEALLRRCRGAGVPFIVNDDLELALAIDADGVHVGRDDGDVAALRARLGAQRLLGVSCYNEWSRAEAAVAAGADCVAFGAMFPSTTKPGAVPAAPELLTRARALGVGVVAIGGITLENAPALVAAGAHQLAVISDVFEAPDPCARARAYAALFASGDACSTQ